MPEWKPEILRRLAPLKLSPAREAEIADELAQHLEDRYQELLASGLTEDAAYRTALDELKGEDFLARSLKRVERDFYREPIAAGKDSGNFFARHSSGHSLRLADAAQISRLHRRRRSHPRPRHRRQHRDLHIVDAVLLRPLPFKDPSKLVMLNETFISLGYPAVPASPLTSR